jgi:hypothetical protein
MKQIHSRNKRLLALAFAGTLAFSGLALAEKPPWAGGGGKGKNGVQQGQGTGKQKDGPGYADEHPGRDDAKIQVYFGDRHRQIIRDYFHEQFRSGHCPPGLAKKNNGCLPPGQAKKWRLGQPLPPGLVYYDLPKSLVARLGPPPSGHRYVRVDSDILLLTTGTMMVIDALQNMSGN